MDNIDQAEIHYLEEKDEREKNLVTYKSKIVGVTFEGRQDVIKVLEGSEPLRVRREQDNQYDANAVAVDVMFGEEWAPIGYIAKDKNQHIANLLDANKDVNIAIASITGGGSKSYGVNVTVSYQIQPAVKKEEAPQPVQTQEVKVDFNEMLQTALAGMGVIPEKKHKKLYKSVLLGKSTFVDEVDGHIRLEGYTSGSSFPKAFYAPFDEKITLDRVMQSRFADVDNSDYIRERILAMWELNKNASTNFGNSIHFAMENYDRNHRLGHKMREVKEFKTKDTEYGQNKALSANPFIRKIVEDFHKKFGGDYIRLNEQFIWFHMKKLCGSIDRVKIIDAANKIVRIQDFKTDGDIHKKTYQLKDSPFYELTQGEFPVLGKELLDLHWLQLSFYAYILEQYGYTVEGLDVYWLNPEKLAKGVNAWEEFSREAIDIKGVIEC